MLPIHFAPVQGYTDYIYRRIHHNVVGGITCYYTPFVRCQKEETLRNKDIRDVLRENNVDVPVVPQIIAANREEFCRLSDILQQIGWDRIDLNMGCPFPMQTRAGRGCGLIPHRDCVEEIMKEISSRREVCYSLKLRLGLDCPTEVLALMPIFNAAPLAHITLHPRVGVQQYKGVPDKDVAFCRFYEQCRHALLYNGDIVSIKQIDQLEQQFPRLAGVMVGRGLLARPTLAQEYAESHCGVEVEDPMDDFRFSIVMQMHRQLFEWELNNTVHSDVQILNRMHSFWEYQTEILSKKDHKRLMKCGNLKNYQKELERLY